MRASGWDWPTLADDVIICGQPPELKSLIFHLEVFPFWAHLLDASALVSEVLAEVSNSGLPCKVSLIRFQEKP